MPPRLVRAGQLAGLMEEVVARVESVRANRDVVIVEGLIPEVDIQVATRLNIEMIKSLGADVIPVLSARDRDIGDLAVRTATAIEQYGDEGRRPIVGVLVNYCSPATAAALAKAGSLVVEGRAEPVPVLAAVITEPRLSAPRVIDVAEGMGSRSSTAATSRPRAWRSRWSRRARPRNCSAICGPARWSSRPGIVPTPSSPPH